MKNTVELVGHYGGDETHALAAWTSTSRELTEEKRARIGGLLTMLAANGHGTPFERSMLHFLLRVDTATHIHLLKHRAGVGTNGESARYKELGNPTALLPSDWPALLQDRLRRQHEAAVREYKDALSELTPILGRKRAKESARFFLPYANQLTLDVSFNFRSFVHFLGLRMKPNAQKEVQEVASQMLELVRHLPGKPFEKSLAAFHY